MTNYVDAIKAQLRKVEQARTASNKAEKVAAEKEIVLETELAEFQRLVDAMKSGDPIEAATDEELEAAEAETDMPALVV